MTYAALYTLALVLTNILALKFHIRRPLLVVSFPLLCADCLANCLICRQSWRNTMSGEAWWHRDSKYWGWTHRVIDFLFSWQRANHCEHQALREKFYGGFWPALVADWRQG